MAFLDHTAFSKWQIAKWRNLQALYIIISVHSFLTNHLTIAELFWRISITDFFYFDDNIIMFE